jgi:hypothetical protein
MDAMDAKDAKDAMDAMDAMDDMDTAQARSSSSGVGEIKTSSNESLLNTGRSQQKSDQVVTRSRKQDQAARGLRKILGNIVENIIRGHA